MGCGCRSTLGVVIGVLNILSYIGITIYSIVILVEINEIEHRPEKTVFLVVLIFVIVFCIIMAVISGLLVMGILKRRHKLMLPWIILSVFSFVCNCGQILFTFFASLHAGAPMDMVFMSLFVGVVAMGIAAAILWAIYTLYRDIRQENNQNIGQVLNAAGKGF